MITVVKHNFLNNKTIKIVSLIIGYSLWSYLGQIYQVDKWITVPVCYYNAPEDMALNASQEELEVHLTGKREDIKYCSDLGLHIDASKLREGTQCIMPNEQMLFLPKSVKMVHYKPLKISITVSKRDTVHI